MSYVPQTTLIVRPPAPRLEVAKPKPYSPVSEHLITKWLLDNPDSTARETARALNCSANNVTQLLRFMLLKEQVTCDAGRTRRFKALGLIPEREDRMIKILSYLADNPRSTARQIGEALSMTATTLYRPLRRRVTKGLVLEETLHIAGKSLPEHHYSLVKS